MRRKAPVPFGKGPTEKDPNHGHLARGLLHSAGGRAEKDPLTRVPRRAADPARDAKHGAALRHLPSGYPQVNKAWMWGALLAVSITGWLHQLTATPGPDGQLSGHGVRDGQAMIATLRHRLIRVPARLIRHAARSPCAYHPDTTCSMRSSPAYVASPQRPDQAKRPRHTSEPRPPEATLGPLACPHDENQPREDQQIEERSTHNVTRGIGSDVGREQATALSRVRTTNVIAFCRAMRPALNALPPGVEQRPEHAPDPLPVERRVEAAVLEAAAD